MKSRLGATISPIFAGKCRSGIRKAISVEPNFTLFHGEVQNNRLLFQGFESFQRSVHSFSDKEDDFLELGPPLAQGTRKLLKLMTEKPEPFMKTNRARKAMVDTSSPAESSPSVKDIFQSLGKPSSAFHPKLENDNDTSRFTSNSTDASNFRNSSSISIENIPSIVNLSQLIEAISICGKISSASMRTLPNGLSCCDVKFENVESSRRAVSVGKITVRGLRFPIRALHAPETVTIRIKNISKETSDPMIHSMCQSIGALEGLARAREDAMNAFFTLEGESDTQNMLAKLNDTIVDGCRWSAHLLPRNSIPVVMSRNEDGKQISNRLAELKRQCYRKSIYYDDLENLHFVIMHLEDQPAGNIRPDID